MCGICGIYAFDPERTIERALLCKMSDVQVHRGPDASGIYLGKNVGIAHRRLSIIDLSGGQQPMSNEDETVWITFNGEIYNYLELREILLSKGHQFKTRSDTEVIIHAYEEYGPDCVTRFRGMFSFAIWNAKERELFAARDRMGIKPFYYTVCNGVFIFASEIKSILADKDVPRQVNTEALHHYLRLRYVPGPMTMFQNIWKLLPGHYIRIRESKVETKKYWDIAELGSAEMGHTDRQTDKQIEEELIPFLEECIRMRLMSEVPLGVFLSGGVDSSLLVGMMRQMSVDRIKTFCIGPEKGQGKGEFDYARLVADRYETEHHEFRMSSQLFYDFLPEYVWHMDEPISDPASIPLYFLSKYSKPHVTVVLSGEGADEIFGGYYIYKKMLLLEKFHRVPDSARGAFLKIVKPLAGNGKGRRYIDLAMLPLESRYRGVSSVFSSEALKMLCLGSGGYANQLDQIFDAYYGRTAGAPALNRMLYIDLKTWLPDDLLIKADKMTMAASQELRVPFLDHRLVERMFSLAADQKVRNNETKYLLKKIATPLIPEAIIKRKKVGFHTPIEIWFKGDLNKTAEEVFLDRESACRTYFNTEFISYLLAEHRNGAKNFSEQLWNLMVFEFWHERFIKNTNGAIENEREKHHLLCQ